MKRSTHIIIHTTHVNRNPYYNSIQILIDIDCMSDQYFKKRDFLGSPAVDNFVFTTLTLYQQAKTHCDIVKKLNLDLCIQNNCDKYNPL